jgi:hypothetical protein
MVITNEIFWFLEEVAFTHAFYACNSHIAFLKKAYLGLPMNQGKFLENGLMNYICKWVYHTHAMRKLPQPSQIKNLYSRSWLIKSLWVSRKVITLAE